MTVGLKAVRELSLRCPLVMSQELLQDLAEYKKFRDKEVATAARGLIGAFRDLNPGVLLFACYNTSHLVILVICMRSVHILHVTIGTV